MKMNNMAMKKTMMAEGAVKEGFSMAQPVKKESPEYPYCLRLYLGHEELMNLGLDKLPSIGSVVNIQAKAIVMGQRLNDENCKTMEIQITDMGIGTGKMKNMAETLYSENEGEDQGSMED